ncbi:MAG: DMT family transporter [Hyphomicrobiaceae bacterium]|nr:DMT family transporter [Hyphomicrobiaceae bacterium]
MQGAPTAPLKLGAAEWGLILLQSMLWGSGYFFIAMLQGELSTITVTALRTIPAAAVLLTVVLSLGYRLPAEWRQWRLFIGFAVLNTFIPHLLVVWGQSRATGGMAAILNATAPVMGIFLAHVLTHDEKLSAHRLAGVIAGLVGVVILVGYDFALGSGLDVLARLALLGAPLCYVLANIFARTQLAAHPPFVIAVMQMLGSMIIAIPAMLIFDPPWTHAPPSSKALLAIAGMGIFGSGLSALCHFTVLRRAGATNASLVTLIMPLTPILLGGLFLGERLSARDITGAAVIATALILLDGRVPRRIMAWVRTRNLVPTRARND